MGASRDLEKLSQSWWDKLAGAGRPDQERAARKFMALLGWKDAACLTGEGEEGPAGALGFQVTAGGRTLVLYFVKPGALDPPGAVIDQGLDFCLATRRLTAAAYRHKADYTFVTDLVRSYLYEMRTEELLLSANSFEEFQAEIAPVLQRREAGQGALDELRRQPRSYVARQLREWVGQWCTLLAEETGQSEQAAALALDRLLVLRYLHEHDILRHSGWRLRKRFADIVGAAMAGRFRGTGKAFTGLCHDIYFDWKADIFAPLPSLDDGLEHDALAGPLLGELGLIARGKFKPDTILESFNFGAADEKARVRMIPEEDHDRRAALNKVTPAGLDKLHFEVDIQDEGYRAVLHWYDALVQAYRQAAKAWKAQEQRNDGNGEDKDIDLFAWSEQDAKRPAALQAPLEHAIEQGLTIYYASPRQLRIARVILYLHVITRFEQEGCRFTRFPRLEASLKRRPKTYQRAGSREQAGAYSQSGQWGAM